MEDTAAKDVEAQDDEKAVVTSGDEEKEEESSSPPAKEDEDNVMTAMTIAAVAKLKVKAMRWARPNVENFENMNFAEFSRYCKQQPDVLKESVLGPTSMKHPSWKGSDEPAGPCLPVSAIVVSFLIALVVGLAVGFSIDSSGCGVGSGAIAFGGSLIVFFFGLVTYMACYGNGLHNPPQNFLVERCGFVCNLRANVLCRYFMMCFYNGHFDIVDCIMNGEADAALKSIQSMNDGNGPAPGGVCWLGDSEITFWHNLTKDMAPFHSNHFNAGFGGSRLKDIQKNVERLCLDWDPSIVIVHASGNDYDFDLNATAGQIPAMLMKLFETIAAHPSVTKIGYMLSSRRPVYSDAKWDFMIRVHTMTMEAIAKSPKLKDIVKILDLRANMQPLANFVQVDHVHLNATGHAEKTKDLLPKMIAVWPPSSLKEEKPKEDSIDE